MPEGTVDPWRQPELGDVLIDLEVVKQRLAHVGTGLALTLPSDDQRAYCASGVAIALDVLDLVDDMASGRR